MIYGDREYKDGETKFPDITAIRQSGNLYVYCSNNPLKFADPSGESAIATVSALILTCAIDGAITGVVYKWSGKPFFAGFVNGFVSCLGAELGVLAGTAIGGPVGSYVGLIIGNTIGSAVGSLAEDLIYNRDNKSVEEMAKSAAQAAVSGILAGVGASFFKYAIDLANEAGSAAEVIMKYDKEFGEALEIFFNEMVTLLSLQEN